MKYFWFIVCLFLLAGCTGGYDPDLIKVPIPSNEPRLTTDYVSAIVSDEAHSGAEYYQLDLENQDIHFYTDQNACILDDAIIVIVAAIDEQEYYLEIGSHCFDTKVRGGIVIINASEIETISEIQGGRPAKLYYTFPEGFVPSDYLDYVNYATAIGALD